MLRAALDNWTGSSHRLVMRSSCSGSSKAGQPQKKRDGASPVSTAGLLFFFSLGGFRFGGAGGLGFLGFLSLGLFQSLAAFFRLLGAAFGAFLLLFVEHFLGAQQFDERFFAAI